MSAVETDTRQEKWVYVAVNFTEDELRAVADAGLDIRDVARQFLRLNGHDV